MKFSISEKLKSAMKIHNMIVIGLTVCAMATLAADLDEQAKVLQSSSDWNGLKKLANDWAKTEPKSPASWLYLGLADDHLNQPNEAINAYEQCLALDSKIAAAWMYLTMQLGKNKAIYNSVPIDRRELSPL